MECKCEPNAETPGLTHGLTHKQVLRVNPLLTTV